MKNLWFYCICFFFLLSCSPKKEKTDEENASTVLPDNVGEVQVMRLDYTDFNYELISNGTISATRRADLRFQSAENIARIYVKNGDRVTQGQKIAELDQFKLKSSLIQSKDAFERSKLDLQDVLIGQGYSLKDSVNIPEDVMKIARVKSNYDQSLISYQVAEYNLKNATLYAPFGGVVANLFSKEYNQPSGSEPFCTIIDNQRPEVVFMILENELALIKTGDKTLVTPFSLNGYTTEGQVTEINPSVDKNGMVRIKASVNNQSGNLYDGMNVKVRVQRILGKQLVIPKTALVLRTNKKVVFTLKEGKAIWNYVQTAQENSESYVVTEGLTPGDSVIYEGNVHLAHGTPVEIKELRIRN
ncbi:MAG: efflux RND transporter periplasmic adaptor subunit [Dysgonamonadaceae bacterium]|jgi:RND family efflux transporter MFP subunit|nr:efflux RND transporter periplasmic adaptor subunit [Dysgonamonadaceae bacterium]